jgi:hypothetical protein
MARLASHEMQGALQHGARVPERPAAPAVGDGNVEQLGRRRRCLFRHVPYLQRRGREAGLGIERWGLLAGSGIEQRRGNVEQLGCT